MQLLSHKLHLAGVCANSTLHFLRTMIEKALEISTTSLRYRSRREDRGNEAQNCGQVVRLSEEQGPHMSFIKTQSELSQVSRP
jgi:hypothetical protein